MKSCEIEDLTPPTFIQELKDLIMQADNFEEITSDMSRETVNACHKRIERVLENHAAAAMLNFTDLELQFFNSVNYGCGDYYTYIVLMIIDHDNLKKRKGYYFVCNLIS